MINLPHTVRVFLHAPATDLRKGFDALSGLVTSAFSQDPTSGHLFSLCVEPMAGVVPLHGGWPADDRQQRVGATAS